MNSRPLYENLDTAFVNLSALVKYLRQREFIGCVRIELNNYHAEIKLGDGNKISVREQDKISGRVAEGEAVFQRLLIRARESGGTIHVYQNIEAPIEKFIEIVETTAPIEVKAVPAKVVPEKAQVVIPKIPVVASKPSAVRNGGSISPTKYDDVPSKMQPVVNHRPHFPFDLHNTVEAKAKQNNQLSNQDWELLLRLTSELLGTVDNSLAIAKLDFKSAFAKVRTEIASDYPFVNPTSNIFIYSDGKILMNEQVSPKLFVASINESLRRILTKLGTNPKFNEVYRQTTQKVLALMNQRQNQYDKFAISPQLKSIVGV